MRKHLIAEDLCAIKDSNSYKDSPLLTAKFQDPINITANTREACYSKLNSDLSNELIVFGNNVSKAEIDSNNNICIRRLKGKFHRCMGYSLNGQQYLYPEECIFLMESSLLTVYYDNFPISIEQATTLLFDSEMFRKYQVFIRLVKSGYAVRPVNNKVMPNFEMQNKIVDTKNSRIFTDSLENVIEREFENRISARSNSNAKISISKFHESVAADVFTPDYSIHNLKTFSKQKPDSSLIYYVFIRSSTEQLPRELLNVRMLNVPALLGINDEGDISFLTVSNGILTTPRIEYFKQIL